MLAAPTLDAAPRARRTRRVAPPAADAPAQADRAGTMEAPGMRSPRPLAIARGLRRRRIEVLEPERDDDDHARRHSTTRCTTRRRPTDAAPSSGRPLPGSEAAKLATGDGRGGAEHAAAPIERLHRDVGPLFGQDRRRSRSSVAGIVGPAAASESGCFPRARARRRLRWRRSSSRARSSLRRCC